MKPNISYQKGKNYKMKAFIKIAIVTLIMLALSFGLIQIYKANQEYQMSKWNNGVCRNCGIGNMVFTSATYIRNNGNEYYYTCDNCGHTAAFNRIMK